MRPDDLKSRITAIIMMFVVAVSVMAFPCSKTYAASGSTGSKITFKESNFRKLKNRTVRGRSLGINLRSMIGESSGGYSIVQGGCTDGKYAYYLMVSGSTQHGRVLKVRMKDKKVVKRSGVLNTWHGNGMTYDSKRKRLVVIAREDRKQEITCIDANTLKITKQQNVRYTHYKDAGIYSMSPYHQRQGLAAIAYVKKYDCYIALERVAHNLIIINPNNFQAIGFAVTRISSDYPGTFQAMDADEKYVYLLLSQYQSDPSAQPYNIILAIDWNSEKMLPVVNAKHRDRVYAKYAWYCGNKKDGKQDAVIRVKTPYEAENIYHIKQKGTRGKGHFYLSEYHGHSVYSNGRYQYFGRDDYVYDLGTF
ncbi:MAG: hypothetical protein E7227_07145 [Clostridiales bacterium]|nr:hypothetical protein [Clostridiales bacterium]